MTHGDLKDSIHLKKQLMSLPAVGRFIDQCRTHTKINLLGPLVLETTWQNQNNSPCLLIDGGSKADFAHSSSVTLSLGDGDSSQKSLDVMLPKNKNYSDLLAGLLLVPDHIMSIHAWGFSGGRQDHQLAVYGNFDRWLGLDKKGTGQVFLYDQNHILAAVGLAAGVHKINIQGAFSLMSFGVNRLRLWGACHYNLLESQDIAPFSDLAISNVGEGIVELQVTGPIWLFALERCLVRL